MLVIPGAAAANDCDRVTRRDLLRVGGSGVLGVSLAQLFALQKAGAAGPNANAKAEVGGGPGPLHLWDPKDNGPANVKSVFKHEQTVLPGTHVTELLPKIAKVLDKTTLMRAVAYTPNGLFNHTAAIYQMMTGYTADKVSPSGQLEPPTP